MPALDDPKLEAFSRFLLRNLVKGIAKGKAADGAAREAGYSGSSLSANARKRANRRDVKARMVELATELATPEQRRAQADADAALAVDLTTAEQRLSNIIMADLDLQTVMPKDVINAVRQLSTMKGWDAPKRMEHTGADGAPLFDVAKLNDEQLVALEGIVAALAPDDQGREEIPQSQGQPH